jgi:hypothetical protein
MGERRAVTHALRVSEGSAAFRSLFAAIMEQGERAGWLELDAPTPAAPAAPDETAGDQPWKVVTVEERRSVAIKSRRGPPVLRDLLREHFRGCRVVLVRGGSTLPLLRPRGDHWELQGPSGAVRRLTTVELVSALRAPRLPV